MIWQLTFEYREPIIGNDVSITVYASTYDEGLEKALSLDSPSISEDNLRLLEAIELDEVAEVN
jgi:hypothetical protein